VLLEAALGLVILVLLVLAVLVVMMLLVLMLLVLVPLGLAIIDNSTGNAGGGDEDGALAGAPEAVLWVVQAR
jgi:hypothetical protein